jgi:hypothetical protein
MKYEDATPLPPQGILVCNTARKIDLPGNNIALPWFKFSEWLEKIVV